MAKENNTIRIDGKEIIIWGKLLKKSRLVSEPFEYIENPQKYVDYLKNYINKPNLFLFLQKLYKDGIEYPYHYDKNSYAVLNIISYEKKTDTIFINNFSLRYLSHWMLSRIPKQE